MTDVSDQYPRAAADPGSPEPIDPSMAEAELWREIGDWLFGAFASIAERLYRFLRSERRRPPVRRR